MVFTTLSSTGRQAFRQAAQKAPFQTGGWEGRRAFFWFLFLFLYTSPHGDTSAPCGWVEENPGEGGRRGKLRSIELRRAAPRSGGAALVECACWAPLLARCLACCRGSLLRLPARNPTGIPALSPADPSPAELCPAARSSVQRGAHATPPKPFSFLPNLSFLLLCSADR